MKLHLTVSYLQFFGGICCEEKSERISNKKLQVGVTRGLL
jgi:hypothetical protein